MIDSLRFFRHFFSGLRWKLISTYIVVTVLALLALEILLLTAGFLFSNLTKQDERAYLYDVVAVLSSQVRQYLQPGAEDLPGLQTWLDSLATGGYASLPPQNLFDSPAAKISPDSTLYVLSPQLLVLAQSNHSELLQTGELFQPSFSSEEERISAVMAGKRSVGELYTITTTGNYRMVVPVTNELGDSELIGMVLLTVDPPPPMLQMVLPSVIRAIFVTTIILLLAVIPFGALFGFIMSLGLTRRLNTLTKATDAWSRGEFHSLPIDRGRDEIGLLSQRLRNMAERIQVLMQDRQIMAQLEERNRLARDLHDTVKQQTFATLMQVRAAHNLLEQEPEKAMQHLLEAENLIKASQQELSLMINELRPAALQDQGLEAALEIYLENWSAQSCIPAVFQITGSANLPLNIERTLYRVVQEALANVARHSRASAVELWVKFSIMSVKLEIKDNGIGFDIENKLNSGFGLQSMQERLVSLGGQFTIQSKMGEGTIICVEVPLGALVEEEAEK